VLISSKMDLVTFIFCLIIVFLILSFLEIRAECRQKSISVDRSSWNNYESNQQDATVQVNLLFLVDSTCFGRCFRPSSGALDCI
jgi:hypothetical protein